MDNALILQNNGDAIQPPWHIDVWRGKAVDLNADLNLFQNPMPSFVFLLEPRPRYYVCRDSEYLFASKWNCCI
jgi:hypothetical protein